MADQQGDKKHFATERRRERARREGQVPKSTDLASAALLLIALGILWWLGQGLVDRLGVLLADGLRLASPRSFGTQEAVHLLTRHAASLASVLVPLLLTILVTAVMVHVLQVGILLLPGKLAPQLLNISPIKGVARLFSLSNVVRVGFGLIKLLAVAAVAGLAVWHYAPAVLSLALTQPGPMARLMVEATFGTCFWIGGTLFVIAALDYGFQRWKFEQDLMMTDQELRDEAKETEGDPQVAARRRQVQRQLAMQRQTSEVRHADVVVTNPTELAIAIKYDPKTMAAPTVLAKGAGVLAQRIRRIALEHGIPIVEKKPLARALYKNVEAGSQVPVEQYQAVAEVLRYVYQLQGKQIPTAE